MIFRSMSSSGIATPVVDNNLYAPAKIKSAIRLKSASTQYMSFNAPSGGNRKKWVFSVLFKRITVGTYQTIFFAGNVGAGSDTTFGSIFMNTANRLSVAGYTQYFGEFSHVFNSTSIWYHIIWSVDTTQANQNDRVRMWVNGAESSKSSNITLLQNTDYSVCGQYTHTIGARKPWDGNYPLDAEFTKAILIDGKCIQDGSLTVGNFGYFDINGNWRVRRDSTLARLALDGGPCSFFLPFKDVTSLSTICQDASEKGNNFTTYGGMVRDGSANDCLVQVDIN